MSNTVLTDEDLSLIAAKVVLARKEDGTDSSFVTDYGRAVRDATITKLAGVKVEAVAYAVTRNVVGLGPVSKLEFRPDTTALKCTELYTLTDLAAVRVQERPTIEDERQAAEYEYSTTAFNYVSNPIGSKEWVLYWAGWLARSTAKLRACTTQEG